MPDTPFFLQAKLNAYNISDTAYRLNWAKSRSHGYDMRADAIPIKAAKASQIISSDYKYKEAYRKQQGHFVGTVNLADDIKMKHSTDMTKLWSDLEYKKSYEKEKGKIHLPFDMLDLLAAKKCQQQLSDLNYRSILHNWTCLPNEIGNVHAKIANELQSDNVYKADLEWSRGIGWLPTGSPDMQRAQTASDILSDKKYRQHLDTLKFTSIVDDPTLVQAKINSQNIDHKLYTQAWNKQKNVIHLMPDAPLFQMARTNALNISQKAYRQKWEESRQRGYDLRVDSIPLQAAKASRDIVSNYKYKQAYEKQKGQYIGTRIPEDDLKLFHSLSLSKIQSGLGYKKDYEAQKAHLNIPVDMLGLTYAKKCQKQLSDLEYKSIPHEWTCLPDQTSVVFAKNAYELQSDALYKADLDWLRGIGWANMDSPDMQKAQRASEILSENKYRQHPDTLKFTVVLDSPDLVQAKLNAHNASDRMYKKEWEKMKTQFHMMPDTPYFLQAKINSELISDRLYRKKWAESRGQGYDMKTDAIPIKAAKASRILSSDFKYKELHLKQRGHHIGAQHLEDDAKIVHCVKMARLKSDREYKKEYESQKINVTIPVDTLDIVQAKKCQQLLTDVTYRDYPRTWSNFPNRPEMLFARYAYDQQSDIIYKDDLNWMKGLGCIVCDTPEYVRARDANTYQSNEKYRSEAKAQLGQFTVITDTPVYVTAQQSASQLSDINYKKAYNLGKGHYTSVLDSLNNLHVAQLQKLFSNVRT
uniref:Nebulin n=1 Tax=Eptatretus burgeri TaxID=7764 RepID=A0A8C4RBS7_EPTBU